jgi:peptide-methionine (S)-S-oxide reductase
VQQVSFGGGCHWCTEAVFQALRGVEKVEQGFVVSDAPDDSYSEAVIVTYDPEAISLRALIEVHLITHASTSRHTMRGKYRSAVYCFNGDQLDEATGILASLAAETGASLVTRAMTLRGFKSSDPRFMNYYSKNPERPFCRTYIDPKLAKLRTGFANLLKQPRT